MVIGLSLLAVVYIALVALIQQDMKKLIAYSSISHMGFVTLGFFVFETRAMEGAIVQMISTGLFRARFFFASAYFMTDCIPGDCHLWWRDEGHAGVCVFHGIFCDGERRTASAPPVSSVNSC